MIGGRRVSPSAVASLRTIFSILIGLSVTNTLVLLLRGGAQARVPRLAALNPEPIVFASVLLFTIVRFYLGNVRHIDDAYTSSGETVAPQHPNQGARRFVLDFVVLIVQALLFGLASFYVQRPSDLLILMIVLLIVDLFWNFGTRSVAAHQNVWFFNNGGFLLAMGVCYAIFLNTHRTESLLYVGMGLLLANGIIDFVTNRAFYFAKPASSRTVFLSAPFTALLSKHGGDYPRDQRKRLETVMDRLDAHHWLVLNAHRRELWGREMDSPFSALKKDLEAIEQAEHLVAFVGAPASPGVQLEIGYALARGKQVLIVADDTEQLPYLLKGLIEHESARYLPASSCPDNHSLAEKIETLIASAAERR